MLLLSFANGLYIQEHLNRAWGATAAPHAFPRPGLVPTGSYGEAKRHVRMLTLIGPEERHVVDNRPDTTATDQDGPSERVSTARRLWLWPVAILVSLPIGGYIADLVVDGVDSVGAALAGGLIVGAVIGAAEWFALRQWVSWLWIPATIVGMAVGLVAGAALVDYGIDRGDLALMGAVNGLGGRGDAGAGARTTSDPGCVLVGRREPAGLGARLVRELVRDLEEHR